MTLPPARASVLAFAALGLLIGMDGGARAEDRPSAPGDAARLVGELEGLVGNPNGPPGAIVIIQRGDDRQVYAAGLAEVTCAGADWRSCGGNPPDVDDHMRIASVSKAFSGAAALALVSEGALSLDSTIGEVLPELPDGWHPVTLVQLLNHTSGLPDYTASPALASRWAPIQHTLRRPANCWPSSPIRVSISRPVRTTAIRTPTISSWR